jgi:hypothetical protein
MTMLKLILSMFLSALLIFSTFTHNGEASTTDKYLVFPPQIRPPPGRPIPANPYSRGCSAIERCRGGSGSDSPPTVAEEDSKHQ